LFGLKEKVEGKKVNKKLVECEMIFKLFGMNESEKKVKRRLNYFFGPLTKLLVSFWSLN
jgi:peroxiredoxin family protein